jgi:hypothetical protein
VLRQSHSEFKIFDKENVYTCICKYITLPEWSEWESETIRMTKRRFTCIIEVNSIDTRMDGQS